MSPYKITKVSFDWSKIRVEVSSPDGNHVFEMTADDFISLSRLGKEVLFIPAPQHEGVGSCLPPEFGVEP